MKQKYHYSLSKNWANDPNGMVFYNGEYHMFFQYNPLDINHGPMNWMHVTTKDFIHFTEHEVPKVFQHKNTDTYFRWHFSGCAVWDKDNTSGFFEGNQGGLVAIWTIFGGCKPIEEIQNMDYLQRQAIAYSYDGFEWFEPDLKINRNLKSDVEKEYYKNIILAEYDKPRIVNDEIIHDDPLNNIHFRDPKVFWHQNKWIMVVAGGPLRIYSSNNLIDWKPEAMHPDIRTECPELYYLPVENTDTYKYVLSEGGRYFQVGELKEIDGKLHFISEKRAPMNYGPDAYAAQSFFNSNIMVQWMNNWSYASNTMIDGKLHRGISSLLKDHNGQFTLFNKLSLDQDYNLIQSPMIDIHPQFQSKEVINQTKSTHFYLKTDIQDTFTLEVFKDETYSTIISYKDKILSVDRSNSMDPDKEPDCHKQNGEYWKFMDKYSLEKEITDIEVFVDTYSVEVYANHRTIVFSLLIFADGNQIQISQDAFFEIL